MVEVYHNGAWGTVCNTNWNYHSAAVACRTAGFNSVVRAVTDGSFGGGTGPIQLDNVQCTGDELTLFDCSHNSWGSRHPTCDDHSRDAGAVCSDGKRNDCERVCVCVCWGRGPG